MGKVQAVIDGLLVISGTLAVDQHCRKRHASKGLECISRWD